MKSITEYLQLNQITEMAKNLNDFRKLLNDLSEQLIQNWCLVKWCDLNPDNNISKRLRNHWATELNAVMTKISNIKLKCGRKDRAIKYVLIDDLELNDYASISNMISKKFNEEGLSKYIYKMSQICSKHINEIINILSKTNYDVEDYINYEIG